MKYGGCTCEYEFKIDDFSNMDFNDLKPYIAAWTNRHINNQIKQAKCYVIQYKLDIKQKQEQIEYLEKKIVRLEAEKI